ncbi:heterokaryon incompatibility protein-domain-containing protein [Paraphoma chrysanthemicola]|nr:heterokaryon incompatibility protein-domain-containing protein [Paraphoma chrysanthemicola]
MEGGIGNTWVESCHKLLPFLSGKNISRQLSIVNDPAAKNVPQRPFIYDYTSRRSTDWAKQCLMKCEESHSSCEPPKPVHVPSRLLHIDHSGCEESLSVKLCYTASRAHTDEGGIRYATLSYCWGGPQDFRLDGSSEDKLLRGILVTLLPKTIIDAVKVAFDLGISWIWIDSLCIRQDDTSDKAIEIAQMHRVYRSSSVTISATRAESCQQGFLYPCSLPPLGRVSYSLPVALSTGELGSIILSNTNKVTPIDHRSWTLQEHLLARRVLRFTDYGQHWSCGTISKFENIDLLQPPRAYKRGIEKMCELAKSLRESRGLLPSVNNWIDIVQQYTRRQFTVASDKLLAISAIAEAWDPDLADAYLAGIWESQLPESLMWESNRRHVQIPSATHVAPSWSWASISGSNIVWNYGMRSELDPQIEIEHCSVELANDYAPYGDVKKGELIISGLLQTTTINEVYPRAVPVNETALVLDLSTAYTAFDFYGEPLKAQVADARLYCFQINVYDKESMAGPSGLILASIDDVKFTRIGIFEFMPTYDDLEEEMEDGYARNEEDKAKKQAVQSAAFRNIVPRTICLI